MTSDMVAQESKNNVLEDSAKQEKALDNNSKALKQNERSNIIHGVGSVQTLTKTISQSVAAPENIQDPCTDREEQDQTARTPKRKREGRMSNNRRNKKYRRRGYPNIQSRVGYRIWDKPSEVHFAMHHNKQYLDSTMGMVRGSSLCATGVDLMKY